MAAFSSLTDRLSNAFKHLKSKGKLSEADIDGTIREIRRALLDADVSLDVVRSFTARVRDRALGAEVSEALNPAQQVVKIVNDELTDILGQGVDRPLNFAKNPPTIIMLAGLQGAGKTTLAGKLGYWLKDSGHTPLLVAADLQRPNAVTQLEVVGERAGVPVTICFNKLDLCPEGKAEAYQKLYQDAGYPVELISARDGWGVERVRELIRGKTTVLAGPSGVGKSSLTNRLQPEAGMEIGAVSEKIKRGKHTTRHSQLFLVEEDTFMLDTPGFSSMYVDDMEPEDLKDYFPEFALYAADCRFLGCVHIGEKVCGVKAAVEEGKIGGSRYEDYRLLYQELKEKRRY